MSRTLHIKEPEFGWMLLCSVVLHLASFFLLVKFHFSPIPIKEGPVYYVDIVNLPVANPRAGTPSSPGGALPAPAPARQEMTLPEKSSPNSSPKPAPSVRNPAATVETDRQFQERMAKIERDVEAKQVSAAIDALRSKAGAGGKGGQPGMPGATGTEAGSDYASYIRSRLTDAFSTTISYQSKNPEAMVRLTIGKTGRVTGLRFEKSSKDRIFEDCVRRAITKAEQTFPPPPGGAPFEYSYRFAPEGVSKK
jgi:colicin import membrane protein